MDEEKKAVEAGYWHLYRYNPALKDEGKNPFSLDSKVPTAIKTPCIRHKPAAGGNTL